MYIYMCISLSVSLYIHRFPLLCPMVLQNLYGSLSPDLGSRIIVPEGCGLAVFTMMQLNWLVGSYVQLKYEYQHDTMLVNYVDNWLLHPTLPPNFGKLLL